MPQTPPPRHSPKGSSAAAKSALQPRSVLRQLTTPSLHLEEVEYAAGVCLARHAQVMPFLACTVRGVHWSSHNHGGYTCRPGTVRFLPSGEPHENYFPARSRCLLVKLKDPILSRAAEAVALPERPRQMASHTAAWLAQLLRAELHDHDDLSQLTVEELSFELLLAGVQEPARAVAPIPHWLAVIRDMLHEENGRRFSLSVLACCSGRHPVHVCRQFHRQFNCTIGEYVRRIRIARAQFLLRSSDLPLAEVALACGFADQSQFTRAFRRIAGFPPRQFQKRFASS